MRTGKNLNKIFEIKRLDSEIVMGDRIINNVEAHKRFIARASLRLHLRRLLNNIRFRQ